MLSPKRSWWPDSPLFYISDITNSSSYGGKSLGKKSMLEHFRANVLKSSLKQGLDQTIRSCLTIFCLWLLADVYIYKIPERLRETSCKFRRHPASFCLLRRDIHIVVVTQSFLPRKEGLRDVPIATRAGFHDGSVIHWVTSSRKKSTFLCKSA